MSNVSVCPKCTKPFVKKRNGCFPYCSVECFQAAANPVKWASDRAEAFAEYRRKKSAPKLTPVLEQTADGVVRWRWPRNNKPKEPRNRRLLSPLEQARAGEKYREKWAHEKATLVAALNKIKLDSGCVDCGYRGHPTALQFDHVRGRKIRAVSQFSNLAAALREAAKCEIRCANCHSIKTLLWKQQRRQERIDRDLTILGTVASSSNCPGGVVSPAISGSSD